MANDLVEQGQALSPRPIVPSLSDASAPCTRPGATAVISAAAP